jgi:hypothetical protein
MDEYFVGLPSDPKGQYHRVKLSVHGIVIACAVQPTAPLAYYEARRQTLVFLKQSTRVGASGILRMPACHVVVPNGARMEVEMNGVVTSSRPEDVLV